MTAAATRDLTVVDFRQAVKGNDHVFVYFWAPNCAPCELFTPNYERSAADCPDIVHAKVNFETEQELVKTAGIKLLPTLMAFKKGQLVFKQAGIANPAVMADLVRQLRAYRTSTASLL
ncbi:thioredoxin family protein [Mycobacterium vicinigordonae]|uniref:Thioredoxin family protein n=1 Tax=Mycobacterium vicinigordonae TaxID=1719132 RepID=A0A7D6E8D8_9MYCO|nr:thioredoxin family protein [Mycobacterium vicinigordonae]QLL09582.1 thioredoxin family protein [Mycobacterium vicinigordonae]